MAKHDYPRHPHQRPRRRPRVDDRLWRDAAQGGGAIRTRWGDKNKTNAEIFSGNSLRHRYLNPHWWALRLNSALYSKISPRMLMNFIGWTSRWSPEPEVLELRAMCDEHRAAIDIGAAYGLYSWHLQNLCQRCIAFEANPDSAKRLRNALSKTEVFACALSERSGNAILKIPRQGNLKLTGHATIEPQAEDRFTTHEKVSVDVRTLDSFEFTNIGFIKIDVEGHELSVLRGAEQTIRSSKPVLLVELNNTSEMNIDKHQVVIWLRERGYERWYRRTSPQNFIFVPEKP